MAHGAFEVAKHYITYRYTRALVRQSNTTDDKILSPDRVQQRGGQAGKLQQKPDGQLRPARLYGRRGQPATSPTAFCCPQDIVEAHKEGIIHFHDADYYAQHMHNCDLVNLEDMLQNGTVITGTLIEKPHSFSTACNIATQIIAQVASNQYGGQSISPDPSGPLRAGQPREDPPRACCAEIGRRWASSVTEIRSQHRGEAACARRSAAACRPSSIRWSRC